MVQWPLVCLKLYPKSYNIRGRKFVSMRHVTISFALALFDR
jgi:hypothetical protein